MCVHQLEVNFVQIKVLEAQKARQVIAQVRDIVEVYSFQEKPSHRRKGLAKA